MGNDVKIFGWLVYSFIIVKCVLGFCGIYFNDYVNLDF
jgi:hypothetical protein